jgi:hypothetical protein
LRKPEGDNQQRDPNDFQVLMLRSAQILELLRNAQILFDGTRN